MDNPVYGYFKNPNKPADEADDKPIFPGDVLVTLEDGRVFPMKKTICCPRGNKQVGPGKRVKLTAKLRQEAERDEYLLSKAAQDGAVLNMKECLARGTDVNCRGGAGAATPLICAAVGGHLDVTKMLVEAGADPELGNGHCDTPLLVAAYWNRMNLVRYFLEECKLDPRVLNNSPAPESPLDRAKRNENEDMVQLITKCARVGGRRRRHACACGPHVPQSSVRESGRLPRRRRARAGTGSSSRTRTRRRWRGCKRPRRRRSSSTSAA